MNILYLVLDDPDFCFNGTTIRTHFLYRALKEIGNVDTVVPVLHPQQEREDGKRRIRWICFERIGTLSWLINRILIRVFIETEWPISPKSILRKIGGGKKYDAVVVRYIQRAVRYSAWVLGPLYVDIDDDPIEVYETIFAPRRNPLRRWYERKVLVHWCRWAYGKCRGVWAANKIDKQFSVTKAVPLPNLAIEAPAGFAFNGRQRMMLLSVGSMGYRPNYEGIDRFIRNEWKQIREIFPEMEYDVVGKDCPVRYQKRWESEEGVKVLGFVSDLDSLYEQCVATVAPIYSGSGTCIKVQESLLRGRICIASDFALRGWPICECVSENGIIRLDNGEGWRAVLQSMPWTRQGLEIRLPAIVRKIFTFGRFVHAVGTLITGSACEGAVGAPTAMDRNAFAG